MFPTQKFDLEFQSAFQKCMKESDWMRKTWLQIQKDFELIGLLAPELSGEFSLDFMILELEKALDNCRDNLSVFTQLLYRVDLPKQLIIENLSITELSEIVIMRSFQKVWLRKHYSK